MAKTNMVEREKRRAKIVKQYAAKRAQLKELIRSPDTSPEEREKAQIKLQKQPRDASASRQRNRCAITGRSRGVYRKFGLSRVKIREVANRGDRLELRPQRGGRRWLVDHTVDRFALGHQRQLTLDALQ